MYLYLCSVQLHLLTCNTTAAAALLTTAAAALLTTAALMMALPQRSGWSAWHGGRHAAPPAEPENHAA
jgi:hypothetical protein